MPSSKNASRIFTGFRGGLETRGPLAAIISL
jgi:hypothetical protein